MALPGLHKASAPRYTTLLRESVARYVMAFHSDPDFAAFQAKTEFWSAFRRYRIHLQAAAELLIEREGSTTH